jgi:hypothetical protein
MTTKLQIAAFLLVALGAAHSILGEWLLLIPLFRHGNFDNIFHSPSPLFAKRTLRFVWHLLTVAWWGLAAIMLSITYGSISLKLVAMIIGVTFSISGLVSIVITRARHFSWFAFFVISALCFIYAVSA